MMTGVAQALVLPCAGVPITAVTRAEAARMLVELATQPHEVGLDVHLCNAYTIALADKDPVLLALLKRASVNFPDGMSVVWANRLLHRHQPVPSNRVYGPDLFLDVVAAGQDVVLRHYLLGSTPQALAALRTELERRFPRTVIVGAASPPFRELSADERAQQTRAIREADPQIVWLGLGTPKQDVEAARLADDFPAVCVAVGAAFDFVAGLKPQAPSWMQDHGLEWVFRLGSEPRRLWRRYLFGNLRFVKAVAMAGR